MSKLFDEQKNIITNNLRYFAKYLNYFSPDNIYCENIIRSNFLPEYKFEKYKNGYEETYLILHNYISNLNELIKTNYYYLNNLKQSKLINKKLLDEYKIYKHKHKYKKGINEYEFSDLVKFENFLDKQYNKLISQRIVMNKYNETHLDNIKNIKSKILSKNEFKHFLKYYFID